MAIFTYSPLYGFYGVMGSVSVHLALLAGLFFCISPTSEAFIGATADINQQAFIDQVSNFPSLTL